VQPVPIPGGDLLAPSGLFNQFFPGVGPIYDGRDADPHGITNFRGLVAMGYTLGTAKDTAGRNYNVITDVRVYQGDYIGAVAHERGRHKIRTLARHLRRDMNRLLRPQCGVWICVATA
jgi:hypothetical protein